MKKTKQGTKKQVVWGATCHECGSEFEEEVGKLAVTGDQRDGPFARSKCPDCGEEMFFYPLASGNSPWSNG
jgi:predicted Zn-ribbon and HTH transcriptional regulator